MINIAYTPEYQNARKEWETVFAPKNFTETESMQPVSGDCEYRIMHLLRWAKGMEKYRIERSYYEAENDGQKLWGAETTIFDAAGTIVFQYRTDDDDADFIALIQHSNGHEYFLFRTGLYGYGVYDLAAKQEFCYIPDAPETFIWTDVHYNPTVNMLAVEGCFWACPMGVILLDFTDPMKESEWVDVTLALDRTYVKQDNFSRWHNSSLMLKEDEAGIDAKAGAPVELEITERQYREWFGRAPRLF